MNESPPDRDSKTNGQSTYSDSFHLFEALMRVFMFLKLLITLSVKQNWIESNVEPKCLLKWIHVSANLFCGKL